MVINEVNHLETNLLLHSAISQFLLIQTTQASAALEQLLVAKLIKKLINYGIQKFITMLIKAIHYAQSCTT
jgi:hypothetical protein